MPKALSSSDKPRSRLAPRSAEEPAPEDGRPPRHFEPMHWSLYLKQILQLALRSFVKTSSLK
jgi:hypothetical protein